MNDFNREEWIDVAKGILIILVVLGHSVSGPYYDLSNIIDYIYLFHMPAFFIISGYLYKRGSLVERLKKRTKRLLLPYFSYVTIITIIIIIKMISKNESIKSIVKQIVRNVLGGQYLHNYCGALWFVTCLLCTEIIYITIDKYIKNDIIKISIIVLFYTVAHIEAWFLPKFKLPFAIDISLITLAYYAIGAKLKTYIFNRNICLGASIISAISIVLLKLNLISYGLELWGHHNSNFILDLLIPVAFSITLFNICKKVKSSIILAKISKYTFSIMALHILLNTMFLSKSDNFYITKYLLIGVCVPVGISFIFSRSKLLKKFLI